MNIAQSSIIAITIGFCLLFALLARRSFFQLSLTYFSLYLVLKAANFALEWLLIHPESGYKALWLGLMMASSFLMAPCLWLFALESANNARPSLRRLSNAEWGLIAVGVLMTVPLMLAAHEGRLLMDPLYPATGPTSTVIHESMLLSVGLFLVQVPYYLWKCLETVRTQTQRNMVLFSDIDDMPLNALRVLMWVMAGNWIINLLRTVRALTMHDSSVLHLLFTCADAGITLWALYVILRRNLLFNPEEQNLIAGAEAGEEEKAAVAKYERSPLTDPIRQRIAVKLEQAMAKERLYMTSDLKLRDLCDHLGERMHYVSQVINQDLGTNFYELVNRYRIQASMELLIDCPDKTILDVALEVGFNSKTTFNARFKRIAAMTPSRFRALKTSPISKT